MESSRDLQPLDPVAAGLAGLLDQIEGVQCWIKDRAGRYAWVNRGFLLNYALERVEQVVGYTDHNLSPAHLADQYRLDDERALAGKPVDGRIELARIAGRSVRAFERMFRRQMQATPQQFLRRLRLRLACRELTASRRQLTAIAAAHGFCDQSHFVREFRREFGVTPGEYRSRNDGARPPR
jgi:AraC-like DNA-binding protein